MELLDISGVGAASYTENYEPVPGAGGSPFHPMLAVNLGDLPMHTMRMKAKPKKAYQYAITALKKGRYLSANAWARRALECEDENVRKKAAAIIAKTDEAGMSGFGQDETPPEVQEVDTMKYLKYGLLAVGGYFLYKHLKK